MTPATDKEIQAIKSKALQYCDEADAAIAAKNYPAFFLATSWATIALARINELKQARYPQR